MQHNLRGKVNMILAEARTTDKASYELSEFVRVVVV